MAEIFDHRSMAEKGEKQREWSPQWQTELEDVALEDEEERSQLIEKLTHSGMAERTELQLDENSVEEIANAVGVTILDQEIVHVNELLENRDAHRWELDPASSEDYPEHRG